MKYSKALNAFSLFDKTFKSDFCKSLISSSLYSEYSCVELQKGYGDKLPPAMESRLGVGYGYRYKRRNTTTTQFSFSRGPIAHKKSAIDQISFSYSRIFFSSWVFFPHLKPLNLQHVGTLKMFLQFLSFSVTPLVDIFGVYRSQIFIPVTIRPGVTQGFLCFFCHFIMHLG